MDKKPDKKPDVFASEVNLTDGMAEANEMGAKIAEQHVQEQLAMSPGELEAQKAMLEATNKQLEEQFKIREAKIAAKKLKETPEPVKTVAKPVIQDKIEIPTISDEEKYASLSLSQDDAPFDVISLPSEGKLYKNGKPSLEVAYLNASDENIITNPNLLQSGKFLEILINRKLLRTNLKYADLHVGDRNAIMIWLRATGYGPSYNIVLNDPQTGEEFETEIDLSTLKTKPLTEDPDKNGHFEFTCPISRDEIKFRLLNVGDIDDVEGHVAKLVVDKGLEFSDASTYTLKKQIVEVRGSTDKEVISKFVETMRLGDVKKFRKHVDSIESGMDMNITVQTPGGESITTFLPINFTFFWPDLDL